MHLKQANYPPEHHNQLHQRVFRKPPCGFVLAFPFAALPRYLREVRSQWLFPSTQKYPSDDDFANEATSRDTTDFDLLFRLNGILLTCQTYPVDGHQGMLQTDSDHLLPFPKLTKDRSFLGSY